MKKKSRIGILIDRFNVGGVEKIAIEQVRALRAIDADASLVVLSRKAVVKNAFQELRKGIPTIYLEDRLPSFLRLTFKFPVFYFFSLFHITYPFLIPFVVKKKEFDYLIVHGTYTSFTAITLKKLRKIPYGVFIWDPIGYILKRVYATKFSKFFFSFLFFLSRMLDATIIRNANVLLVGGDAHNKYLRTFSKTKPIIEIPPSVHPVKTISKEKDDYILMVTAWKRGKNPEYIYEIIKKIPTIKIVMAGKWLEKAYQKEFEQFCKEKHITGNIKILGEVSESQLNDLYTNALVLLQTNDDRGFGMPALEAAGHGATFIIPEGQGVCRLFTDKKDGYYTKEKDTRAIVSYLQKFIRNSALANSMGKHAWETVAQNYSWVNHAKQLNGIVHKIS